MTRERWERLAPLVDAVLDQPLERRRAYIAEISGGDASLAADLARFVDAYAAGSARPDGSIFEAAARERSALISGGFRETTNDVRATLQASLGASYVLEREIGGGGMSRVFVAEEPGLGRRVVIKVLPPELTEGISAERFAREVKLAASLQQANIVPVLAAGTADGFPYYVMPFVEGRSLRERLLRDGALPVTDAIGILRDVARALVFAHARGVVHRDIKPGNILLSDRTAVVTDFGIAKALGAARSVIGGGDTSLMVSRTGTSIGTPAYMAPEQAAGDPNVDHRADIYAFGCVAYELLTGQPPFVRDAPHHVIAAHFQETPRPVTELRPDAPPAVARLIASCLEKDPSRRPQSGDDILLALDAATSQPVSRVQRRSRGRTIAVAIAAVAIVALAAWGYTTSRDTEPLTFAVVPFRNMTRDTALDYRSDGIGDEILNGMAKVKGVQIVGRSTAFRYKDRPGVELPDIRTIERVLGARLLLTGTLRENDGRVTISAQLNDSTSRGEMWSDSFTRASADLGSMTDEIVRRIADTLHAKFGGRVAAQTRSTSAVGTANAAAYDLYLIGQAQLRQRGAGVGWSIESFQRAIGLDSNFARAHAALANALELEPFFSGTPPSLVKDHVIAEAQRALALDSTLADAYVALALAHGSAGQWETGDAEMRRAIQLEPDNAMARLAFARQLVARADAGEAFDQLERARKLESTSPIISAWLAYSFFLEGRADSAIAEVTRATQLGANLLPVGNLGSLVSLSLGRPDVARRLVDGVTTTEMTNAPYIYAKLGDTATANRLVREMESKTPRPWFVDAASASVLLATHDTAAALSALERSQRSSGAIWVNYISLGDPAYDEVRTSPRFIALLREANVGLRVVTKPRQRM
ncbi:MAG TPA: protein kinase [Gemmatimonadaceae bacterium]